MANEQDNVQVVQNMFSAIGQGSMPAALDSLAENVEFRSPVTRNAPTEISWARTRHGRNEVTEFFRELSEKILTEPMETLWFTAQDDRVIAEGKNRGTVKSTGVSYEHDWVMVFTLRDGKIARCWHYYDTGDVVAAFQRK